MWQNTHKGHNEIAWKKKLSQGLWKQLIVLRTINCHINNQALLPGVNLGAHIDVTKELRENTFS